MPTFAAPPSSAKKYFFSPSGVVMTCWSLALWDPAALLNESLELSLSSTCWAHSSERNATPTPASFSDRGPKYRHNKATDARVKSGSTWGVTSERIPESKQVRKGGGNHTCTSSPPLHCSVSPCTR